MAAFLVVIGALAWWPDALLRLREAGGASATADPTCDPTAGPCVATFADGRSVTLRVTSGPVRATAPMHLEVLAPPPLTPTGLMMQGVEMPMGLVMVTFTETAPGAWAGDGATPVCTLDRMTWRADVTFADRTATFWLPVGR